MRSILQMLPAAILVVLAPFAIAASPDDPPAAGAADENPFSSNTRFVYGVTKQILLRAAETMPEEHYGFRPADTVRTFGQIVGHVADSQYAFCSTALGEKNPARRIEKTATSKADLISALKEAFAYCDRSYDGLTDATAKQTLKLGSHEMPRLGVLTTNKIHMIEHYGNLVTYMRMKGLVPPTSDPTFMRQVGRQ